MKKKIIFAGVLLILLLSTMILSSCGKDVVYVDDFELKKYGDGYRVTAYWGNGTEVAIPENYRGKPVFLIGQFSGGYSVKTIKISNNLNKWDWGNPFMFMSYLESFTVDEWNTRYAVVDGVLYSKDLETLRIYPRNKAGNSFTVPNGVTKIGDSAFAYCNLLESITIPSSVTTIGYDAFENCDKITTIDIPSSVTSIYGGTFSGCDNIKYIHIPSSVTRIGSEIVDDKNYNVKIFCEAQRKPDDWSDSWASELNKVYWGVKDVGFLENGITWVQRADDTIEILEYEGQESDLVIPDMINGYTVTSIGSEAFYNCDSLVNVKIPATVKSIGKSAFEYCSSLVNVRIPAGVKSIENKAFASCTSLEYVFVPLSVEQIGENAFSNSEEKIIVFCEASKKPSEWSSNLVPYYAEIMFSKKDFGILENGLIWVQKTDDTFEIVRYRGDEASLVFPEKINGESVQYSIGDGVFADNTTLTSISFSESVVYIGKQAFEGCANIKEIRLPNSLVKIGDSAFSDCVNIEEISFPDSLVEIGSSAFSGCSGLKEVALPKNLTVLNSNTFKGCANLKDVILPNSLTEMGKGVFDDCPSIALTEIDGATYLGNESNPYLVLWSVKGKTSISSFDIKEETRIIYDRAFSSWLRLNSVIIPGNVKCIGAEAFYACVNLEIVTLGYGIESIGASAFYGCANIKGITIPNSVKTIKDSAFYACEGMTYATIGNGVTYIGGYAFYNCKSLTKLTLGTGLETISTRAFSGCDDIGAVVVPISVRTIDEYAFYGCSDITFYCEASEKPSGWVSGWNNISGYSSAFVFWGFIQD